jgi:hypothetical protein
MKHFTNWLLLSFSLLIAFQVSAQELINSTYLQSLSKTQILSQFGPNPFVINGVDMYRIHYTTPDVLGVPDTASGLLIIPDDLAVIYPLLSYSHGTVASKNDVPSKLQGGYELPMVMAAYGYVTVAADFLGLGDSRGFHPYVHADSEASASVDMLYAVQAYCEQNNVLLNDQLFISGYSQGGHASLATQRLIETELMDDFTVTASSPMSGPYEIYGAQSDYALGDEEFFYPGFLPYVALGYQRAYGNIFGEIEEFFKPAFVPMVEQFRDGIINLNNLNTQMILELNATYGEVLPKYSLQDSILDQILNNPDHPVSVALADNNLHEGWVPQVPTRFPYCGMDDQVSFQNSIVASDAFNANGAPDTKAELINPDFDHGECVLPATTFTMLFFRQYQMLEFINSVFGENTLPIEIFPNPVTSQLNIEGLETEADFRLYDLTGRVVVDQKMYFGSNKVALDNIQSGIYFVEVISEGRYRKEKIVVK